MRDVMTISSISAVSIMHSNFFAQPRCALSSSFCFLRSLAAWNSLCSRRFHLTLFPFPFRATLRYQSFMRSTDNKVPARISSISDLTIWLPLIMIRNYLKFMHDPSCIKGGCIALTPYYRHHRPRLVSSPIFPGNLLLYI
jgi:hypothetical protein